MQNSKYINRISKGLSIFFIFTNFCIPDAQTEFSGASLKSPSSRRDGNLVDNPMEKKLQASSEFVPAVTRKMVARKGGGED